MKIADESISLSELVEMAATFGDMVKAEAVDGAPPVKVAIVGARIKR